MSEPKSDKRGFTISLILLLAIAALAILIFVYVSNSYRPGSLNTPSTSPPGFFVGAARF